MKVNHLMTMQPKNVDDIEGAKGNKLWPTHCSSKRSEKGTKIKSHMGAARNTHRVKKCCMFVLGDAMAEATTGHDR